MDSRIKRSAGETRQNRTEQDASRAAPEENFPVAHERRRARNEFQQTVLPSIPDIPGYHLCWLATNSQYDPIHRRFTLGYTPVRSDEMPGYDMYKVKEGDQSGHIMCNEMLLCKMPMDVYQDIMLEHHHYQPMDEAEKIKVQQEQLVNQRDRTGKAMGSIEGGLPDESNVRLPTFT
jgi:hypothetical protein